ncbi:MAG: hypothetical protein A3E25_18955 [Burkholderiales bacterium RIFCSPHIGHO2_12_FULL_69_20]|nr:MAG: hypothetical protein A3E25_18955 [Burkholderiales bacterium RIFCSPHIGHO2_12_FULL_69_20]
MRFAVRLLPWALLLSLLLVAGVAAGVWLAIERQPLVQQATPVSHDDIARARQLLRGNDPRRALPGITRAVVLTQRDLELLLNQAGQRFGEVRSRVRLQAGLALVQTSLTLPRPWPTSVGGGWLNVQVVLRETEGLPEVQRLRLGRLPVPGWLAEAVLPRLLVALDLQAQGELAQRLVSRVAFRSQHLVLAYAWPDNAPLALTNTLLRPDEQARLRIYADRLATLGTALAARGSAPVSMAQLLPPLFALAAQRSPDAATAARENRAALVALAFNAYGSGLAPLIASAPRAPGRRAPPVTLAGRRDSAQHYLISAALAAEGGGPLADAIGLYKEVTDSRGGSGFSFNDLAADRAGTRLGLLALRNPLALQARLAKGVRETELLPDVSDLPESLREADFKRRYGGVQAPGYRQLMIDIEARLDRLPLLRPAP